MYVKALESDKIDRSMIEMVSQGTEQVMMLILQHNANLNSKALVHKAFDCIVTITLDERVQNFIETGKWYVPMCLKRALNFEGRHT